MTKKDYELIAQGLKLERPDYIVYDNDPTYNNGFKDGAIRKWQEVVYTLANGLAVNPKFDRSKFLAACGIAE